MRERRTCFGELVQIDGSDYDWFEGRNPRCTLLVFVDDTTDKLVELRFVPHESFFGYCEASRHYFERYGKPEVFYSDKHGIFHINHPNATSGDGMTDFGRAMNELGIEIICANTPQAKGEWKEQIKPFRTVSQKNSDFTISLPLKKRISGCPSSCKTTITVLLRLRVVG